MKKLLVVGLIMLCALIAPVAAGSFIAPMIGDVMQIDMLAADQEYSCNAGANGIIAAGTGPAGTGRFDPFLTTFTPRDGEVLQEGINSPAALQQDETFFGGKRTHAIQLKSVPFFNINGIDYYKFNLDANEAGTEKEEYLSIGMLRVFVDAVGTAGNYDPDAGTFGTGSPSLVWDLDTACGGPGGAYIALDYRLEEGSGWSDLGVFIPKSLFPADENVYVYLYTRFAEPDSTDTPISMDLTTNDGFEEWGVEERVQTTPYLKLVKTVTTNYPDAHPVLTANDFMLTAEGDERGFSYPGDTNMFQPVTAGYAYTLSESFTGTDYYSANGWSCDGGIFDPSANTITLGENAAVTCTIHNQDADIPVPEFPAVALPVGMIIGFLGVVIFVRSTKEN